MHKSTSAVTVLLPFCKVGEEFDAAIGSIVHQSFPSWELLLVSNNGNDEGLEIANRWVAADSRVQLVGEPQQGIAHALNKGLELCHTPYIARMDADDISHPDRLKLQVEFLEGNPDIGVVSSQTSFRSDIPGSEGFSLFVEWQNSIITPGEHELFRFAESPLAHPSVMFRKELIDRFGLYNTGNVPEDYELWLRWMDQGVRFHKIPQKLLVWNDHTARLTRTHENYSREAFFTIKCEYLARWILGNVHADKRVVICGSSRIGRKRAALLEDFGVEVYSFTDVKKRPNRQVRFITLKELTDPAPWFLVNFIARRGVAQDIREHFTALGFVEGRDFIMGA